MTGSDTAVLRCADLLRMRTSPEYHSVVADSHGPAIGNIVITDSELDEIVRLLAEQLSLTTGPPQPWALYLLGRTGHPQALTILCDLAEDLLPTADATAVTYQVLCSAQDCAEAAGGVIPDRLFAIHETAAAAGDHQISELATAWLRRHPAWRANGHHLNPDHDTR